MSNHVQGRVRASAVAIIHAVTHYFGAPLLVKQLLTSTKHSTGGVPFISRPVCISPANSPRGAAGEPSSPESSKVDQLRCFLSCVDDYSCTDKIVRWQCNARSGVVAASWRNQQKSKLNLCLSAHSRLHKPLRFLHFVAAPKASVPRPQRKGSMALELRHPFADFFCNACLTSAHDQRVCFVPAQHHDSSAKDRGRGVGNKVIRTHICDVLAVPATHAQLDPCRLVTCWGDHICYPNTRQWKVLSAQHAPSVVATLLKHGIHT